MSYKRRSPQPIVEGGTESTSFNTNGVVISGATTTTALTSISLTAGQVPIGSAAGLPAAATLTGGTGITVTNGNNSITLSTNGTTTLTYTSVNTTPYVVLTTDDFIGVDCSGGAITLQLPNAPATGRSWTIKDTTGSAQTNNIAVTTVGGVVLVDAAATYTINTQYAAISVLFNGIKYLIY